MATTAYSEYYTSDGIRKRSWLQYEFTLNTATQYAYTLTAGIEYFVPSSTAESSMANRTVAQILTYQNSGATKTGSKTISKQDQIGAKTTGIAYHRTIITWNSGTIAKPKNSTVKHPFKLERNGTGTGFKASSISIPIPEKTKYAITYVANGGTIPKTSDTKWYDETLTLPSSGISRTGYTFAGWKDSGGTVRAAGYSYTTNAANTFTAQWTVNKYVLTLNSQHIGTIATKTIPYGSAYSYGGNLPTPTRTGYSFAGWWTASSGGNQVSNSTTMGAGNTTIWAHWTEVAYTISYTLNGGTVSGNPTTYYVTSLPITLNNPAKTGYTFTGWSGTGLSGEANKTVTFGMGDIGNRSYTAHYSVNNYTLYFNAHGGSVNPTSKSIPYGSAYNYNGNLPTPERAGYGFLGWFTAESGGTQVGNSTTMGAANTTIHAHWVELKVTINYKTNGGTVVTGTGTTRWRANGGTLQKSDDSGSTWYNVTSVAYTTNDYVDLWNVGTPPITRTGYYVVGTSAYNTKADGTGMDLNQDDNSSNTTNKVTANRLNGNSYLTADKSVDIYPKWIPITYTIAFDKNASKAVGLMDSISMTYDLSATLPSNGYFRTGYTFVGWASSSERANSGVVDYENESVVTNLTTTNGATITLYAVWRLNLKSYNVTGIVCKRCKQDGTDDEEGSSAYISCTITPGSYYDETLNDGAGDYVSVMPSSLVIAITNGNQTIDTITISDPGTSVAEIMAENDLTPNDFYNVSMSFSKSISDPGTSRIFAVDMTKTDTISNVWFLIDVIDNASGGAVGILGSAPDDKKGLYVYGGIDITDASALSTVDPLIVHDATTDSDSIRIKWDGTIEWKSEYDRKFGLGLTLDGNSEHTTVDIGWNYTNRDGAYLGLRSVDYSRKPGAFDIGARDGTNLCVLTGKPDGTLSWGGQKILIQPTSDLTAAIKALGWQQDVIE